MRLSLKTLKQTVAALFLVGTLGTLLAPLPSPARAAHPAEVTVAAVQTSDDGQETHG